MSSLAGSLVELRKNDRQWAAFNTRAHCVVLAPPGSGKTKLLTSRLAYDLATEIDPPQGAACITLTNAAANELRERIEGLGVERRPALFVGTVHSFVLSRIIQPYADALGLGELKELGIATSRQRISLYDKAIRSVYGSSLRSADVKEVRATADAARQRLTTGTAWSRYGLAIQNVVNLYENSLQAIGLCDFLGIISTAVAIVEMSAPIRRVLNSCYPRIYVDEYQDLAPGLDRLVRALCLRSDSKSTLFAVGDPDQAVFAFTGTRPELLDDLTRTDGVWTVELDRNYRSGQDLIDLAGRMRPDRPQVVGTREGGSVQTIDCPEGLVGQISTVVELVSQIKDSGTPLHEIAVICPWNQHCEAVSLALRGAGVPASMRESQYRLTSSTRLIEEAATWSILGRETSGARLSDILQTWRSVLGANWNRSREVSLTRCLLDGIHFADDPACQFLDAILACGASAVLSSRIQSDNSNELEQLSTALRTGPMSDLTLRQFAQRVKKTDRVEVTNMTLSKGLEFDHVFVIGLDEEMVPNYRSLDDPLQLAEDRRKFYVAITRAREQVALLYSGFVMKPWGEPEYAGPSRFLYEIDAIRTGR